MSTPRISPSFRREKGSPSPCLGALLDPSCQETIPSACSDKLIPENVFFSLLSLFPPPAIMSFPFLTRSHPSFLPPYKPWVMNEVLKIKTWMQDSSSLLVCHHLSCKAGYSSAGRVRHASVSGRYYFSSRCLLWADVRLFVRRNSRAV